MIAQALLNELLPRFDAGIFLDSDSYKSGQ